ncbi:prenyltransferase [Halobacterium jilantaiense]|uniref:1,4-dihydroxy-2-naphthoate octaprenyltransferase n=1 Tax=Halobacterium jilantaiense TaxID=355548 RepID=A0A1I0MSV0_9EURY|nr:prenyltransferase [Halobacterium jilantaiense]SEV91007.1 1,4-dihydroxy-2-naphthoate octaprenyltransferase [Halobacterium jilantaiense]
MNETDSGRPTTDARTVAWVVWKAARPAQLLLIGLVYAMGASLAFAETGRFPVRAHAVGLAAMALVAASVHYANEYADAETDRLTDRTPFSGGSGALPRTGLSRRVALAAGAVALAAGVGLVAATAGSVLPWLSVCLLAAVAVLGWQYSVGPLAFAWRGLGELVNAVLGGLLLPVYAVSVATGRVTLPAVAACLPFAVVVFLNLLDTTWPDRRADAAVGKRTLATRWSTNRLRGTYWSGVVAFAAATVALADTLPSAVWLATVGVLPVLAYAGSRYTTARSPAPTVAAMVALAVAQTAAWLAVAAA